MGKRVLFLSNGHGEDLNSSLILQALQQQQPTVELAALPIVGEGRAYQRLGVPIIGPTETLPSGGFNYINFGRLLNPANWTRDSNPLNLVRDLLSGLVALTWGQVQAVRRYSRNCDLLMATGDVVPILFARITGRPFMAFLVSTSSYYEGRIKLPLLAWWGLRSPHCRHVFTRDAYTAQDLQRRGLSKASFAGYPVMDVLTPTGKDLQLRVDQPVVALLPGSRLPEALHNLALQLQLCSAIAEHHPCQFVAALVPSITVDQLRAIAVNHGWIITPTNATTGLLTKGSLQVSYHQDAFSDILHQCDLALGMAGTAVEQAVGLGKPVVQIIGPGPQFTYPFAEAQMRLLGPSVMTVGQRPATPELLTQAAAKVMSVLADSDYRQQCVTNGRERLGDPGGSERIASHLADFLHSPIPGSSPRLEV